jgi:hypothetical protein
VIIARLASVSVKHLVAGSVHEAETCWYDTARWPRWVDSLARVVSVDGDWPAPGASVRWESGPAGRGRVTERVLDYEPLAVQNGVEVELSLRYKIKRRSPLTALVDLLFVRRPMTLSLGRTLSGFEAALAESRHPGVG